MGNSNVKNQETLSLDKKALVSKASLDQNLEVAKWFGEPGKHFQSGQQKSRTDLGAREVARAGSSWGKRKEVWHLLMLPKQEVLRGRAGSSLLFKGENTEKAVVQNTGPDTRSWKWSSLDTGEHSELTLAWPACSAQRAQLVGPKGLCVPHSPLSSSLHRLTWRTFLSLQAFSQAPNPSEGLEAR